jgi:hypothetical protein
MNENPQFALLKVRLREYGEDRHVMQGTPTIHRYDPKTRPRNVNSRNLLKGISTPSMIYAQ